MWILTSVTIYSDMPSELNVSYFEKEETAIKCFNDLQEAYINDIKQEYEVNDIKDIKEYFEIHESIETDNFMYIHYLQDYGREKILQLEKIKVKEE